MSVICAYFNVYAMVNDDQNSTVIFSVNVFVLVIIIIDLMLLQL